MKQTKYVKPMSYAIIKKIKLTKVYKKGVQGNVK